MDKNRKEGANESVEGLADGQTIYDGQITQSQLILSGVCWILLLGLGMVGKVNEHCNMAQII